MDWTEEQKENINYLYDQNIDAFDSSSDFYTDNCNQFTSSKGNDVFLEERKKQYYPDITLCEQGCTFVKYNKDTEKVTCKCDYKNNTNNYTNVVFVKNEKNKKFLKDLILENIQAMKCIKVIFKGSNLKSNAGFIMMIIFLILFVISGILYYFKGGASFLDNFLKKSLKTKVIKNILISSVNNDIDNSDNGNGKKKKQENNPIKPQEPKDTKVSQFGKSVDESGSSNGPNEPIKNKSLISKEEGEDGEGEGGKKKRKTKRYPDSDSDFSFDKKKDGYDVDSVHTQYNNDPNNGGKNQNNPKKESKIENKDENKNKDEQKNKGILIDKEQNKDDKNNNKNKEGNKEEGNNPNNKEEGEQIGEKEGVPEENKEDIKTKNMKKKRVHFKHQDSEGEIPGQGSYDNDSEYSGYKNENGENIPKIKNNDRNNQNNNINIDEDNNINKSNKKEENKKQDEIIQEQEDISNQKSENEEKIDNGKEKEENKEGKEEEKEGKEEINQGEQKPKKIREKRAPKNSDKSLISIAQKAENYSEDSINSGVYRRNGTNRDMISDTSSEKDHKDNKSEKSLISAESKEKKNKEEKDIIDDGDFSVANMSKINEQFFGDDSKNEEDIIKVMDQNNNKENKKEDNNDNVDVNLNINEVMNNNKEDANAIKINDINNEDSLEIPIQKEEEKDKNKKLEKEAPKKKNDISYVSKFSQVNKQKVAGFYDNDSSSYVSNLLKDDSSQLSKNNDNVDDLLSESDKKSDNKSDKANPPGKKDKKDKNDKMDKKDNELKINSFDSPISGNNEPNKQSNKISRLISSKAYMKSSDEHLSYNKSNMDEIKEDDELENTNKDKINVKQILNTNDDLITLDQFGEKYQTFISIYLADLRKHHILYFSFSCSKDDINNIFLKLSLFAISIVLYFSLNTLFMTSSKMSNAYFDYENSGPIYVIINLFLPFIICTIIILLLKYFIMPNSYVIKIIRTIQNEESLKEKSGVKELEQKIVNDKKMTKKQKKRSLKNSQLAIEKSIDARVQREFIGEKDKLENKLTPMIPKYKKIVIIYFLVGFIFLGINWYMLTSFCSVYINTGVKLIVNSFISLFTSFILPCILGFIPALIGFLAKKLNNRIIFKIYKFINKVI